MWSPHDQVCNGEDGFEEPDLALIATYEADETTCDGLDNDCDGATDEALDPPAADELDGVCAGRVKACNGVDGFEDPDPAVLADYEAAESTCDGLDNDCDGTADEDTALPADNQNGVCAGAEKVCNGAAGLVEPDYGAIATFEAIEVTCDGLDNDCDGAVDENLVAPATDNQEGVCAGTVKTCDGVNGFVDDFSGVASFEGNETTCDGLDNDCDGTADEDISVLADIQDGICAGAEKVCVGVGGLIEPDYTDLPGYDAEDSACDNVDSDCDGLADEEFAGGVADVQAGVCSGATKVCNGGEIEEPDYAQIPAFSAQDDGCDDVDNDCDGTADEDFDAPADVQDGVCAGSTKVCNGGVVGEPDYTTLAGYDAVDSACDDVDSDCDGNADEDFSQPADLQDGVCAGAGKVCNGGAVEEPDYTQIPDFSAQDDTCDDVDNDCNGTADEDFDAPADVQDGVCAGSTKVCNGGVVGEPDYTTLAGYDAVDSACDNVDSDCDGGADEDFSQLADLQDGVCAGAGKVCNGGVVQEPDYSVHNALYELDEATCDGNDNDCDGAPDEGGALCGAQLVCDGGACVADGDEDGVADVGDNCPTVSNLGQADRNGDNVGDACEVVDYCRLQFVSENAIDVGQSVDVYGRLYEQGLTDQSPLVDVDALVVAEAGYGPPGEAPDGNGWVWSPAAPTPGWNGNNAGEADNDEYFVTLDNIPLGTGTHIVAFRFSVDGGNTYTYCDSGAGNEGSSNGFAEADAHSLTVNSP